MKLIVGVVLLFVACAYSTPVDNVEAIDPFFDAYRDVRILLFTRLNRNIPQRILFRNLASIQFSFFSAIRPTRVLIHGWWEDEKSDIGVGTAAALLDKGDFNVLVIDWSEGSQTINYVGAANRVPTVGAFIASQIDFMHEKKYIQFNRLSIVGFSLGAHIAGMVGKNVQRGKVASITGLDPAGPLFSVRNPEGRLDAADADYVECIHTNGPTLLILGAGIGAPIGHADFFVNGGTSQPGCLTNTCSHLRAVDLYVESIRNNRFHSLLCPTRDNISSRRCNIQPGGFMGGDGVKSLRGSFYLETNRNSPFGQGQRS